MMERAAGIEPACLTWKDSALPLSYARDDGEIKPSISHSIKHFLVDQWKNFDPQEYFHYLLKINTVQSHLIDFTEQFGGKTSTFRARNDPNPRFVTLRF